MTVILRFLPTSLTNFDNVYLLVKLELTLQFLLKAD